MTQIGRLNIDVSATTTKFDAAMTRVRNGMRSVGAAGSAGTGIAGGIGFGALGSFAGLSGPLMAVGAAVGGLTAIMREANRLAQANIQAAKATDLAGVSDREGALRKQLGNLINGGGVDTITNLRRQFELGGGSQGMFGLNAEGMETVEFLERLSKIANREDADKLVRMGMLPRSILALRNIDPALFGETAANAGRELNTARTYEQIRRNAIASGIDDPNFINAPATAFAMSSRGGTLREVSEGLGSITWWGQVLQIINRLLDSSERGVAAQQQTANDIQSQGPGI